MRHATAMQLPALHAVPALVHRATDHFRRIARHVPSRRGQTPRADPCYADQAKYKLGGRRSGPCSGYIADMADDELASLLRAGVAGFNAWREEHPLASPDLAAADLRGVTLSNANLAKANLERARLDRAYFFRTGLDRASLDGAYLWGSQFKSVTTDSTSFRKADLGACTFSDTAFRYSSFEGADLRDATFGRSVLSHSSVAQARVIRTIFESTALLSLNVTNADFKQARFANVVASDIDWSKALHVDTIEHTGPSKVDLDTLRHSTPPVGWLRGVGLSDFEIEFARLYDDSLSQDRIMDRLYSMFDARAAKPMQIRNIFISYSHADRDFVSRLESAFNAAGIRTWRDVHDLLAGRTERQIDKAIRLHETILLVLSRNSVASDWVEWEAQRARDLERQQGRDLLCPIALDDGWKTSGWSSVLRQQIEKYNILDFSGWKKAAIFEEQFAKLRRGLQVNYSVTKSVPQ